MRFNLPENLHIDADLLRRLTGLTQPEVEHTMFGMSSVGYHVYSKRKRGQNSKSDSQSMIYLEWSAMNPELSSALHDLQTSGTGLISTIVNIMSTNYCETHVVDALVKMNFSSLSTATTIPDVHVAKS